MAEETEVITVAPDDDATARPMSSRSGMGWWIAGGVAAVSAAATYYYLWSKSKADGDKMLGGGEGGGDTGTGEDGGTGTGGTGTGSTSDTGDSDPPPTVDDPDWMNVRPLPVPADVDGIDLKSNWGKTPEDLRPLFALMERVSGIQGSGRLFAVIAKRESGFVPSAHNESTAERDASRNAYKNASDRNPTLKFGAEAAEFGSGGLFAGLAPYFLWTGVPEVGGQAPLLGSPPSIMFLPRVAAFGAAVYLQRLVANYRIDDHADVKVGWANPSLLKTGRGNATYQAVRGRFLSDAADLEIALDDVKTIPKVLSASRWPGVSMVFAQLVGALPTPRSGGQGR